MGVQALEPAGACLATDPAGQLGAKSSLLGWHLPSNAPTVFSLGVFGLILCLVMLFFPRGLVPAAADAADTARRRLRR